MAVSFFPSYNFSFVSMILGLMDTEAISLFFSFFFLSLSVTQFSRWVIDVDIEICLSGVIGKSVGLCVVLWKIPF